MIFKWETEKDKIVKFLKISPKKKLEWLYQMHEFMRKAWTAKQKSLYYKIRKNK